ncbi:MAG: hypothetical protein HZB12_00920 [Candidatus Yonathbacteria bacterium]|nr:hypothetical protein [Candidatus Yonathbacteria bacterium]
MHSNPENLHEARRRLSRQEEIDAVLKKLAEFEAENTDERMAYAIRENIAFMKAARSLPRYLWWLFTVAPKLDGSRLLELTDFPVEEWDVAMHERLIALQKRKQPGLITPLVSAITEYIQRESRDLIIADLGAGGMEVDRQVAEWALKVGHPHTLTIVAVDKSPVTRRIADKNLKELADGVEIIETGELSADELERIRKNATKKILIVMCTNDIFALEQKFQSQYFDLVYHSLFRHHLNADEQEKLDRTIQAIGKRHFEFDGYKSWAHGVIQSLFAWTSPVFLNGTIISMARYKTKNEANQESGDVLYYANTAHYLRKF